ncbi:MAG: hypothetical protein JWP57_3307, partial [Spirosoma sp.]|nr:hypothetical protein [Spirosoma sp.]
MPVFPKLRLTYSTVRQVMRVLILLLLPMISVAQNRKKKDYLVTINTQYGPMKVV